MSCLPVFMHDGTILHGPRVRRAAWGRASSRFAPVFALATLLGLALSAPAEAAVLTFDDLAIVDPLWEEQVTDYGTLSWSNTWVVDGAGYGAGTGYANAAVSGNNVVLNGYGDVASASSGATFTFNGAYFTSAFRDGMGLTIEGYRNGVVVNTLSTTINTSGSLWVGADFQNIDMVSFSTFGGTVAINSLDFIAGTQFAMDNFTINQLVQSGSNVPELDASGAPSAVALLFGAMLVLRGRRQRADASA